MLTDEEKIEQVCSKLDRVECCCGQRTASPFHWAWGRLAVLCRICDADLIAKYGDFETVPGFIDLNKWSKEGNAELSKRIQDINMKASYTRNRGFDLLKVLPRGDYKMAKKPKEKDEPKATPTEGCTPNPNAPVSEKEQQEGGKVQYPRRIDDKRRPGE